jgi:hypothetical protein
MSAGRAVRKADAEATDQRIGRLEPLRELFQAIIDDNQPLLSQPEHEAAARRRIAEATRQIQNLERDIGEPRGNF